MIGNNSSDEDSLPIDVEQLITEIGDISVGPETETEFDLVVPDETESEAASEETVQTETESESESEMETEAFNGPINAVVSQFISSREAMGEQWAVSYEDLESGTVYGYHDDEVLQSASVVKLFIMGAVYRYMCYPPEGEAPIEFHEEYDGQLRETIVKMITVSDNDCANLLIERLGEGDFYLGAERIHTFCEENGYEGTTIGRRFLGSNENGDNYTTAAATRMILSDMYHGKLVNEEASAKMLDIVKAQTLKNKIPSGLPSGFTSGNKTGEMPEGYGLGCIENDCAIVFPPEGEGEGYILTIMSNNLGGRNSEAVNTIIQISSNVAQWYLDNRNETAANATGTTETAAETAQSEAAADTAASEAAAETSAETAASEVTAQTVTGTTTQNAEETTTA